MQGRKQETGMSVETPHERFGQRMDTAMVNDFKKSM